MVLNEYQFRYDFVHEYLRYCQKDRSTITGCFDSQGYEFFWGAEAEYGPPPDGGLLIEMWSEETLKKGDTATFRYWHSRDMPKGKSAKGRAVMRDELTNGPAQDARG